MDIDILSHDEWIAFFKMTCGVFDDGDAEKKYEELKSGEITLDDLPRNAITCYYAFKYAKAEKEDMAMTLCRLQREEQDYMATIIFNPENVQEALARYNSFLIENKEKLNNYYPEFLEEYRKDLVRKYNNPEFGENRTFIRSVYRELFDRNIEDEDGDGGLRPP